MDQTGRITGAQFRKRRLALGGDLTISVMATLARVGQGVVDKWERGVIDAPRDENYWALLTVLEALERNELVGITARRSAARGGGVVVAFQTARDLAALSRQLDEIADADG